MTPEQRIYDGNRAREVLENEAFQAAFADIEAEILEQWKNSPARDVEGRERLWSYLMLLRKVRTTIENTLNSGKLAMAQLQHEQKVADLRVPEWRAA